MPKNIDVTTDRNQLQLIPMSNSTGILEHKVIADLAIAQLLSKGFTVVNEEYRISVNKDIVQGVLHLNHAEADVDDGMMLTWVNSYEKTTGFRCEMGAYNIGSHTELFIDNESKAFRRNSTDLTKHTIEYLQEKIDDGLNNYKDFIIIRDKLKASSMTKDTFEKMMGTFFFKDAITSSQLIAIKNSKFGMTNDVWGMWLITAKTFKSCHPKAWFKQQGAVSGLLIEQYIAAGPVIDPAQTNILSQIDEESPVLDAPDGLEFDAQPESFGIQSDAGNQLDAEASEEPKILSLADYDLKTKENSDIQAESLVEAAEPEVEEEISIPEPIDETPIFSLETYEPSEFPLPPEDLPISTNPAQDEYSGAKQDADSGQQEEEKESIESTQVVEELGIRPVSSLTEPVPIIEPKPVEETKEETTDLEAQLLAANPALENRQESSSTSARDETEPNESESNHKKPGDEGSDDSRTEGRVTEELLERHEIDPRLYSLDPELDNQSSTKVAIPLEEQVALSEVQPVSEAEAEVSKAPVIDEPKEEVRVTIENNNSKEKTLESPNFEF